MTPDLIEELRFERDLNEYFEDVFGFISENFDDESQSVLHSFVEKILDHDDLSLEQMAEAINGGLNEYVEGMFSSVNSRNSDQWANRRMERTQRKTSAGGRSGMHGKVGALRGGRV